MKSEDIMKYLLGAGAIYLLYLWAKEQGWLEGVFPPQLQPPTEPPTDEATAAPSPAPPPPAVTQEGLQATAAAAMGAGWDGRLAADQWNFYYTQLSGVTQTTDLFPPEDRGYQMTVDEYWQRRQQAGLGVLAKWPVASAWAN